MKARHGSKLSVAQHQFHHLFAGRKPSITKFYSGHRSDLALIARLNERHGAQIHTDICVCWIFTYNLGTQGRVLEHLAAACTVPELQLGTDCLDVLNMHCPASLSSAVSVSVSVTSRSHLDRPPLRPIEL